VKSNLRDQMFHKTSGVFSDPARSCTLHTIWLISIGFGWL